MHFEGGKEEKYYLHIDKISFKVGGLATNPQHPPSKATTCTYYKTSGKASLAGARPVTNNLIVEAM